MTTKVEYIESTGRRVLAWFSCGASSAVAAALAIGRWPVQTQVVLCDTTASEHPDNKRFITDVEKWIDREIIRVSSLKYTTVDDVFEGEKYMSGIAGARCTVELKKVPRFAFQRPDDIHVFGFTVEEGKRIALLAQRARSHVFAGGLGDG